MKKSVLSAAVLGLAAVVVLPLSAAAHVVVSPGEVGVGKRQVFSVGVPNESETAQVVSVRLVIPDELESLRPNVKPGWNVEVKKTGTGEDSKVTEIIWSGGSVPVDQRDEFLFQAKAPAKTTELNWKAYETYSDGTVVAWDQEPKGDGHGEGAKPYSITKVVDDLSGGDGHGEGSNAESSHADTESRANLALVVGGLGLLVASGSLALRHKQ